MGSDINTLVQISLLENISPSYNFDTNDNDLSDNYLGSLETVHRKGNYDRKIIKKRRKVFDEEDGNGNFPEDRNRLKDE